VKATPFNLKQLNFKYQLNNYFMAKQKQPSQRELEDQVEYFNGKYPVGSKLKLKKDFGGVIEVTVSNKATILGGHSAVGWFEEISGCYSLDSIVE